ncbi:MAG: hypothetical protein KBF93_06460 [Leptospiraceae bacterium]|nr:hypothetical protein [Leptospiraceae bacterium]
MNFFSLAESEIWYIWPETNAYTVLQVFIFILLFVLVILVARLIFIRRKTTDSSWTHILNYAYNKKLSAKEINVLEHFFNSLDLSVSDKAKLLSDKKSFQNYLYSYLKKYHSDSVESYVKILDKLFPMDNNLEIKSLLDIHVGEVCAIEFEGLYFLARVINKTQSEVLLSINDNAMKRDKEGSSVSLYFYRNNLGGFLIPGLAKKISTNGMLFRQEGDIETKGEEHLVAEIKKDVEIFPWGISLQESNVTPNDDNEIPDLQEDPTDVINTSEENTVNDAQSSPTNSEVTVSLKATMIKLSDRAILLSIKDPYFNDAVLKKVDIWELALNFTPDMTPILLKGKLMRSNYFTDSFLFKFVSPSELDLKIIFEEIKKHSPVRGFIS